MDARFGARHVQGVALREAQECGAVEALLVVVVAEHHAERYAVGCDGVEHVAVALLGGLAIDDVARKQDEVWLFGFHHVADVFDGGVGTRVAVDVVRVGELCDFERAVGAEAQSLCEAGEGRCEDKECGENGSCCHDWWKEG